MNKTVQTFSRLLVFGLIATFVVFYFYKHTAERLEKKTREIEHIESHRYNKTNCEQYALVASKNGWYPCYKCETKKRIYLYKGEIWKYGKTCNGQDGRYSNGLPELELDYIIQFSGNESECLIEEKNKIYNYPNLPECRKRKFVLTRPAGNKIDR